MGAVVWSVPLLVAARVSLAKIGSDCAKYQLKLDVNTFLDPNNTQVKAPSTIPPASVPLTVRGPSGLTESPLTPRQLWRAGLLASVDAFPSTVLRYGGKDVRFVGISLARDPAPSPCIRTLVKAFAPTVFPSKSRGGQAFVKPADGSLPKLEITAFGDEQVSYGGFISVKASPANVPVTFDDSQRFFLINVTAIAEQRSKNGMWQRQVKLYEKTVAEKAASPGVQMVLFERFILDLIRYYRYHELSSVPDARSQFEKLIFQRLAQQHGVDCPPLVHSTANPKPEFSRVPRQCILAESLLRNELGPANPFMVSDALGNSGLAIGPHQIDIGQHPDFAEEVLLAGVRDEERRRDLSQFFASLEALSPYGFSRLYSDAIPAFNLALQSSDAQDRIMSDFLKTVDSPVPVEEQIALVKLSADQKAAFEALVMDFSNKWAARVDSIATRMPKRMFGSACEAAIEWIKTFESMSPMPADVFDARRRAYSVLEAFSSFENNPTDKCPRLLGPV